MPSRTYSNATDGVRRDLITGLVYEQPKPVTVYPNPHTTIGNRRLTGFRNGRRAREEFQFGQSDLLITAWC